MTRDAKERLLLDLFPHIRQEVAAFCRRAPLPREDAEQEAVLAAWVAMDRIDESLGFRDWTFIRYRVVGSLLDMAQKNHLLGSTKYHKHPPVKRLASPLPGQRRTTIGDLVVDHRESPMDQLLQIDAFEDLSCGNTLLRRLFVDGATKRDIAAQQGVSPTAISDRYRLAIRQIRGGAVA